MRNTRTGSGRNRGHNSHKTHRKKTSSKNRPAESNPNKPLTFGASEPGDPAYLTPRPAQDDLDFSVEQWRLKLKLLPWLQFRREAMARIKRRATQSTKQLTKQETLTASRELRRTGRTTRAALYAIAEAKLLGWPIVVVEPEGARSSVIRDYLCKLVTRLDLQEFVRVMKVCRQPCIVYVDHAVGYVSRGPDPGIGLDRTVMQLEQEGLGPVT